MMRHPSRPGADARDADDRVRATDDLEGRPWTVHLYGTHLPAPLDGFDDHPPVVDSVVGHG